MGASTSNLTDRRPRLLVAIASHGEKNNAFLQRIIQNYQSLPMDVDIVVVSESPKTLDPRVRVVVGLPSPNPWSLPFAHKPVFAENVDRYDLFVYSEDDMEVTERHLQAFLEVTPALAPDEIAGYLRYEADSSGTWYVPEAHESAHWKPETVKRRGAHTIAEFSNEHAGFYVLTQDQLRRALASGNFLRRPYEGRYGLPETAATDPYTCCGFRKVVCISSLEDFLIHHLPDRYIGRLGTSLPHIQEQVKTLMQICDGSHPASTLCEVETKIMRGRWSKCYDEQPCDRLLALVPRQAQTLLSVGCGSGAVEARLKERGMTVTALPLDSVVGAAAARLGIEVIYGSWQEAMRQLADRKFDCVLTKNLLHLQPKPEEFLAGCAERVAEHGSLLVAGPNFNRLPNLLKQTFGSNGLRTLRNFAASGINVCGPATLKAQIRNLGLNRIVVEWLDQQVPARRMKLPGSGLIARDWILKADRPAAAAMKRSV